MRVSSSVGKALILALFSVALPSCSKGGDQSGQNQSGSQQANGPQLEWNKKAEKQLRDAIAQAPANGLKPDLFLKGDLPKDDAQRQAVLTQAALRYAEALAHGYADPAKLSQVYTIPRPGADVRRGLAQAIQDGNVAEWLASLPPQTDEYRALSQAHVRYLQLAAKGKPSPIDGGKPIKPGRRDPRIPLVAAALIADGIIAPTQPPPQPAGARRTDAAHAAPAAQSDRYSPQLVAAVKHVQAEFGLKPDGVIGGDTLDALNADAAYRGRALAVAMERLRWLQRDPPKTRIDVNTAAAFLDYWRDGQIVDHRNVVAGEPEKATPQLQANMFQLVANPIWRIPDSIVKEELADKTQAYLAANDMELRDGRLVQLSGDKNSLGYVKFDMDDPQQIYLHDTPAKALFALPERHRSHGCVRVENAIQFATMLADQDGILDKFQEALAGDGETYVKLKTNIPVRLLYQTAFWDGSRIQFRPDVYGWDDDVGMALGLVHGLPRRSLQQQGEDIGP